MGYLRTELGDVGAAAPGGAVTLLVSQVNRFSGPQVPASYQYVSIPFPAMTTLDMSLAVTAITIYLRRATDAYNQFHDAGSAAAIAAANLGFADPVAFVSGRMSDVTSTIAGFADSLGLPSVGSRIDIPPWGIGAAIIGAWLVLRPSRKAR